MRRTSSIPIAATLAALFAFSPGGCAVVPYPVIPDVDRFDDVHLAGDTLLTVGPSKTLERIGNRDLRSARRLIDRLAAMIEPTAIVCLAILIGTVVMAAVLPLIRLQEIVG